MTHKLTTFKGFDIYVNGVGEFYTNFEEIELTANTLESLESKIKRCMATAKSPVKRVRAFKQTWAQGTLIEIDVTSVVVNYNYGGEFYEFWTSTTDKSKRREKTRSEHIYKLDPEQVRRITQLDRSIIDLRHERDEIMKSGRYTEEMLMNEMGFKKPVKGGA